MPRALIVDDEPGIRFALRRWFERQQWTIAEAGDGTDALRLLRDTDDDGPDRFDLVVCDLHLPSLGGDALVRILREERPTLVNRVVLTTGDSVSYADAGSVLAEHPHVLQKPFGLGTLASVVARVFGR
ncbi:MAG: response regulator [Gemmatimonas sp.]|uniref:response regulator n=1 Tax=Gemmatimonas sp. TaxID=1962908 RepID=UPI00391F52F6|nr:response regulator [Gemmatimonadota bacterium]